MRHAATALALIAAAFAASAAHAQTQSQTQAPRPKPAPAHHASSLQPADFELMARALDAARQNDWAGLRTIEPMLTDPLARKLVQWRIARANERSSFYEMTEAVRALQGWPNIGATRRDAELSLADLAAGAVPTAEIARWFADFPAETGEGKVAHAEALMALGMNREAEDILRDAWRNDSMRRDTQRRVISLYAPLFSQDDTLERADYLAWASQANMVRDLLPLLPSDYRALYEARLAAAAGDSSRIQSVPARLQNDAGLLYERARRMRQSGDNAGTTRTLRSIAENPRSQTGRRELWNLRHLAARASLEDGDAEGAYDIVRDIGMSSGAQFADAEFLAGWIALRFLNQAERAEAHFHRLALGVSTPISVSRGWYWTGRAREARGDESGAREAYEQAAIHVSAFYGQMAAARMNPNAALAIPPDPIPSPETRQRFEQRELVRALHILGEQNETGLFGTFAMHLEDLLDDPEEIVLLADMALQYGMQRHSLRVAKDARNRTLPIFQRAFPVAFSPPEGALYAEPALALAISRQETEFEPRAVSSANARGLMQLLPATAQAQARRDGLPYRHNWLLDDPGYNAQLGSSHLESLIGNYNGSYIVAMAAYNAGPGRARQWIERFGDPRHGGVDPIDWIEQVPFGETRNYIQRVLENLQVYRAQWNGGAAPLDIEQDLRRGELPQASLR